MAVFKGDCTLLIDSGVGTRRYSLRTANVAGAGADRATWQGDAGSTITLFFRNETSGVAPGDADNLFELLVYYETGTGTLVKTLHSGTTPPADGTSYTLHLTANGDAGGGNRCGQLRLYIRADRNAVVAYDRNSDNNGGSGTAGTGDQGCLRSNMLVSDMVVSAYPAGSKFAYGTATNENFTVTATHTQRFADTNNETVIIAALNAADADVEAAAEQEVGATTTTAASFTTDDTYAAGDNAYGFRMTVDNNGLLLTTEKWTVPVASGANVTQNGANSVKRSAFFTVNPDVTLVSVTPGQSVYSREETASVTFGIQNSRAEALTRSMTALVKDGNGTTKKTITDTGGTYGDGGTSDYAITASDRATWDLAGEQWTLQGSVSGARFTNTPNAYGVSRLQLFSKTDLGATVDPATITNAVKTGKTAGTDNATIRNRGQTLHFDGYLYNVRGERLAAPTVNFNVRPADSETYEESNDTVALSAGRFQDSYAVDTDEATGGKTLVVASQTTGAANQPRTGIGGSGNFAETDTGTPEWSVSNAYTALVRMQDEATRNADPQVTAFTISRDVPYLFVHVTDASGDIVVGAVCDAFQLNPSGSTAQSVTGITTGADGWSPDPGQAFDTRAPAGTGWIMRATLTGAAANNGNTGTDDQAIVMLSAFTADKNVVIDLIPLAVLNTLGHPASLGPGTHPRPGDMLLLRLALKVSGVRTAPDLTPAPQFSLSYIDTTTWPFRRKILQTDGSWKSRNEVGYATQYFDFKTLADDDFEWNTLIGTQAQFDALGVANTNGYLFDTGTWPGMDMGINVSLSIDTQEFRDDADEAFIRSAPQHPYGMASLTEDRIAFDPVAGHHHTGPDSRAIGER